MHHRTRRLAFSHSPAAGRAHCPSRRRRRRRHHRKPARFIWYKSPYKRALQFTRLPAGQPRLDQPGGPIPLRRADQKPGARSTPVPRPLPNVADSRAEHISGRDTDLGGISLPRASSPCLGPESGTGGRDSNFGPTATVGLVCVYVGFLLFEKYKRKEMKRKKRGVCD